MPHLALNLDKLVCETMKLLTAAGVNVAPCSNSASPFQCFCAIIQSQAARRLTDMNRHDTITDANGIE
jgi:hypothetical protein